MNFLLKAKHWQVFILTFGLYVAVQSGLFFGLVSGLTMSFPHLISITSVISMVILTAWQYSIASEVNRRLPAEFMKNLMPFIALLSIKLGYNLLIFIYNILRFYVDMPEAISELMYELGGRTSNGLYLTLILSVVVNIYFAYVLSKLIELKERNGPVGFGDHFGTLLLFLFYPIGVWFIQPRVNRIFSDHEDEIRFDLPLDHNIEQQ